MSAEDSVVKVDSVEPRSEAPQPKVDVSILPSPAGNAADATAVAVDGADDTVPCRIAAPEEIRCTEGDTSQPAVHPAVQAIRSFAFTMFALFVMCFSLNIVTWRMPDPKKNPQLPDLGFDLLGPPMDIAPWTDVLVWFSNITMVGMIMVVMPRFQKQAVEYLYKEGYVTGTVNFNSVFRQKYIVSDEVYAKVPHASFLRENRNLCFRVFCRYAQVYGLSCLLRVCANLFTSLPTPNNECRHPPTIHATVEELIRNTIMGVVTFGSKSKHCGDLLYSGHSIVTSADFISLWIYGPRIHRYLRPWAAFCYVCSWFTIIASRSHYSDDILFAGYCTMTIYVLTGEYVGEKMRRIIFPFSHKLRMMLE